ncbi:MAG: flagellar basal body-associated FliL family protein [Sphingopyxis sp.]
MAAEETENEKKKPKKGKLRLVILLIIGIAVVASGGAAAAYYFLGTAGAHHPAEPERPKLVPRDDADEDAVAAAMRSGRHPDPRLFQSTYVELGDNFTANMAGSNSYVQVGVALSTYYDSRVIESIETHKVAIRSAILMTLTNQDPLSVNTPAGRSKIKHDLTQAINAVLVEREGFGGIDDVHFTSFVTQ